MRIFKTLAATLVVLGTLALAAPTALAASFSYSATADGNNTIRIQIRNAEEFSEIDFFARQGSTLSTTIDDLDETDGDGDFSGSVRPGFDFSNGSIETHVTVDGERSNTVIVNGDDDDNDCDFFDDCDDDDDNDDVRASDTSVNLDHDDSVRITLSGAEDDEYFIEDSPTSSIATADLDDDRLTIRSDNRDGDTSVEVCDEDDENDCVTINIEVDDDGNDDDDCDFFGDDCGISASDTSVNLDRDDSATVTLFGSSNDRYFIEDEPDDDIATASLSGNRLRIESENRSGGTSVEVCLQINSSDCVEIEIFVDDDDNDDDDCDFFDDCDDDDDVDASRTNVNLDQDDSTTVTLSGGEDDRYSIEDAPSSSIATVSLSGDRLTIRSRNRDGETEVEVCDREDDNDCVTIDISVDEDNNDDDDDSFGDLQFFPSSVSLQTGQSTQITAFRNGFESSLRLSSNSNSSVASVSINGNNINVFGLNPGSTSLNICTTDNDDCGSLFVTVSGVLGSSTFANGTLVNDNGTIYILYRNTKAGFTNFSAFLGFGFEPGDITFASTANIPSGFTISSSQQSHPWGSWVKNGNTVYFVHESGLIPVPSFDVFHNNGGQDRLVVPMNGFDFSLPIMGSMGFSDSRLR